MSFRFLHICEVCGKAEVLSPEEAHDQGWDYPPYIGSFGAISPRTCGECSITDTLWYAVQVKKSRIPYDLNQHQLEVLVRILGEPENLLMVP